MQRAAEPIKVDFKVDTVPDIIALNRELIQLAFDRKLDGRTLGAINNVVANQLRILLPSTVEITNEQKVEQVSLDDLKKMLIKNFDEKEQLVLCKAIAKLDKAQSGALRA